MDASRENDAFGPDALERDAPILDAAVLDARVVDARVVDGGRDANADAPCVLPPSEMPPTTLVAERAQGVNGGWIWGVAQGAPGVRLASGLYAGTSLFTWEGASSPGPTHFVSRVEGDARWTVFPRAPTGADGINRLNQLAEHDGVVYAAGQRNEAWSFTADGETLSLPAPTDVESGLRTAITVLALDAGTGRPLWGRTIETEGGADYLGGMVVDDDGILLAWRTAASSTSTLGTLRVDGVARTIDLGPADGRVRIARLDTSGTVQWVHAIGGAVFSTVDLAPADGGAILGLFVTGLVSGSTGLVGLDPAPPPGSVILVRLDAMGLSQWSTAVRCTDGALSPRSGAITYANGRLYTAFLASTPSLERECRSIAIGPGDAADPVLSREETGAVWFTTFAVASCDGELAVDRLFGASVMDTPGAAIRDVSADARSVAITGYAGAGGFVTGSGTIAGIERAMSTDGFLAITTPDLDRRFFLVLGTTVTTPAREDDYGTVLGRVGDTVHLGLALSGPITLDGITIPGGASLVRFRL